MDSLAVVVITRDEEENLAECLDSVPFADEIIIVDDGSSDSTLDVAGRYTEKVFRRRLDRFGRQKQFAIEQANADWILVLDADERVTPELAQSIKSVLAESGPIDGYRLRRRTWLFSEPVTCTGWYKFAHLRLFRRGKARYVDRRVHEFPELENPDRCGRLQGDLDHFTYASLDEYREKLDRYSRLAASDWYDAGRRVTWITAPWWMLVVPWAAFVREFFVQGGWRGGRVGLRIAAMSRESAALTVRYLRRLTVGAMTPSP
ncbi:MAG: glycosyltransferase [Acidobacteria bacterium]|nr:glycosyltransferase [Acidobacteriota bacterium]